MITADQARNIQKETENRRTDLATSLVPTFLEFIDQKIREVCENSVEFFTCVEFSKNQFMEIRKLRAVNQNDLEYILSEGIVFPLIIKELSKCGYVSEYSCVKESEGYYLKVSWKKNEE